MPKLKEFSSFILTENDGAERTIIVGGRLAWALVELIRAGKVGLTAITAPGPRWSGYIHRLRRDFGIDIETETEPHGGPFSGHHARYHLRSRVHMIGRAAS